MFLTSSKNVVRPERLTHKLSTHAIRTVSEKRVLGAKQPQIWGPKFIGAKSNIPSYDRCLDLQLERVCIRWS